jgi:hypothetical protein
LETESEVISETGRNLIFILSLPRSGSTLLSAIIGNHASVSCPPEPWLLLRLREVYGHPSSGKLFDDSLASLAVSSFLNENEFIAAARQFALQAYNSILARSGGSVFVDKTPRYYHILDFIEKLFPEARKIWLKRNPLDIAASYKTTWSIRADSLSGDKLGPHSFDFTMGLPNLSGYFAQKSSFKHELRYEDLVVDPEREVKRLAEFCGIDFDPSMLNLGLTAKGVRPLIESEFGDRKIRESSRISPGSVGAWKHDLEVQEIRQLTATLGSQVFVDAGYAEVVAEHPDYFDRSLDSTGQKQLRYSLLNRFRIGSDIHNLEEKLAESEADRTARLGDIHKLQHELAESQADGAARLADIHELERKFAESQADGAARLADVHKLGHMLAESQADGASHLADVHKLEHLLAESQADGAAHLADVHKLEHMLAESQADGAALRADVHKLEHMLAESQTDGASHLADVHKLEDRLAESLRNRAALLAERDAMGTLLNRLRQSYVFFMMRKLALWGWLDSL